MILQSVGFRAKQQSSSTPSTVSNVSMRSRRRMCLSVGGTRCSCPHKSSMDMLVHNSKVPQISLWYRIPSMPHDLTYSTTLWAQAQMRQTRPALTSYTSETLVALFVQRFAPAHFCTWPKGAEPHHSCSGCKHG